MSAGIREAESLEGLPDFCSLEEVSKVFRVSRATAYRMAEQGSIPCLRIGRRMIVSKKHLMCWINRSVACEKNMGGE